MKNYSMSNNKPFKLLPRRLKNKYSWGDKVLASGIYECSICCNYQAFRKGEFFSQCQDCINRNEEKENKWFVTNELLYFMSKNMNIEFDKLAGFEIRLADKITELAGSMNFVYLHIIWFAVWVIMNLGCLGQKYVFDPFPFGLLTMIVSLEAIFLATFIMVSQNIISQKTEFRAEHEYQINLQAEKNVAEILAIVKDLKKENEFKAEQIENIKETIEDIATPTGPLDVLQETVGETPVPIEAVEKEHYEEQEQLLDEAGIDIMPESAPPVILEEVKEKKRGRKKKADKTA